MAGGFINNTRRKLLELPAISRPTGGGQSPVFQLPKTGIVARLFLAIRGSVSGTLSVPNALGMASIIRRVRLVANSGIDIFNMSGAGFHYLLREMLESEYIDGFGQSNARSAVTATTYNLDMVIPLSLNLRDAIGNIAAQNEQTLLTLYVDWEADANVATGATVTGTCTPIIEVYTVPPDMRDWPPFDMVHQILEDAQSVSGAGQQVYYWQRGNTYLQVCHGLGIGASGADGFSRAQVRVNQSDYLDDLSVAALDIEARYLRGRARVAGTIPIDYIGSSGLGCYGTSRDVYDSAKVTDLASVITATGAGTLYTMRRQLVALS